MGLVRDPAPVMVMGSLLRDAGLPHPTITVPLSCEQWFVLMANELADYYKNPSPAALGEMTTRLLGRLPEWASPVVLPLMAPHTAIPDGGSGDLFRLCKGQVRREIPAFCGRVVAAWRDVDLATA
jgi:hypothetical protein